MKTFPIFFSILLIFISCEQRVEQDSDPDQQKVHNEKPSAPCEDVSWANLPVITHGYDLPEHENVVVEAYVKNGRFDSLIQRYELKNTNEIEDDKRRQRSFNLPDEITSSVDFKISIGHETYRITDVKTEWTPKVGQHFLGYFCEIGTFQLNGEVNGRNIILSHPSYEMK